MACICLRRRFIKLQSNEAMKADVCLQGTAVHNFGACLLQLASTSLAHRHFTRISFERCSVCFDSHLCDQFVETLVMWLHDLFVVASDMEFVIFILC